MQRGTKTHLDLHHLSSWYEVETGIVESPRVRIDGGVDRPTFLSGQGCAHTRNLCSTCTYKHVGEAVSLGEFTKSDSMQCIGGSCDTTVSCKRLSAGISRDSKVKEIVPHHV